MSFFDLFKRRRAQPVPAESNLAEENEPGIPPSALAEDGTLLSDLWIDRPDALAELEKRVASGRLTAAQGEHIRHVITEGYTVVDLSLPENIFEQFDETIARLWSDKPASVAYAYHSQLTRFRDALPEHRKPSYRIADLHTYSPEALELFLQPTIFSLISAIWGEPAVALQSLYFEWGSQQALHRDPVYVMTRPPSHLLACWIALEDIGPDCGPLVYVPRSHRLPYYQYEPGQFLFKHDKYGVQEVRAGESWDLEKCQKLGLKPIPFTGKRGTAFIWHHSLLHGGSIPNDPNLTRKSFVTHYSTRSTMSVVLNSYQEFPEGRESLPAIRVLASEKLIERGERAGFTSPLALEAGVS
jgi:phytanoyl-CoA hydroxylase